MCKVFEREMFARFSPSLGWSCSLPSGTLHTCIGRTSGSSIEGLYQQHQQLGWSQQLWTCLCAPGNAFIMHCYLFCRAYIDVSLIITHSLSIALPNGKQWSCCMANSSTMRFSKALEMTTASKAHIQVLKKSEQNKSLKLVVKGLLMSAK